ncbi:S-layer homology domain-containing protein [Papillibacter cinnamivorans]|uniref:S-layer homology domain-containing protein n=1 Tax=Papillibacter cinnamivorans DSM 12816 TaxID=1122930 RepID=A0A1W2C9J0_9FIRM|nr:S-layer homology domain-containing protein [Papillibacter cinnamivorans]SMC81937.1 S-layer homology domain-containing protein [Papillibacter cinnamivorans DSM 12816]
MKKLLVILPAVLGLLLLFGHTFAAPGSQSDPLISLSYITDTYLPSLSATIEGRITAAGNTVYGSSSQKLTALVQEYSQKLDALAVQSAFAPEFIQTRVKSGDALTGTTGTGFVLLAGSVNVTFSSGAVINVSTGTEILSGSSLAASQRYLVAEYTTAVFTVSSDTAVVEYEGNYSFASSTGTDYNAMADALKLLGLFRGGDTGYGSGYMLENKPSRVEGLIMFIRLLGEENEALSYAGTSPFKDVPSWASSYVNYAYSKGYTNGVSSSLFGTYSTITAPEYMTLILRSMGYSDASGDFTWDTSLSYAYNKGLLTSGEQALLASKTFYRAQVVYVSYYSLDAALKDGSGTLLQKLIAKSVFGEEAAAQARAKVTSSRIA